MFLSFTQANIFFGGASQSYCFIIILVQIIRSNKKFYIYIFSLVRLFWKVRKMLVFFLRFEMRRLNINFPFSKALDVHMAIALLRVEGGLYSSETLDDDLQACLHDLNAKDASVVSRTYRLVMDKRLSLRCQFWCQDN